MDTLHSPEVATPQSPEATIAQSTENAAASSSVTFPKGSPAGSKTPESTTGCRSPGSPIGDDACPICLGSFTDKCAAGSCLHNFCLVCLKEWAKQRPVCPLCKQSFTKILYDIKSETDYKEWKVPILFPNDLNDLAFRGFRQFRQFFDPYERSFFGYRSTFPRLGRRRHPASSINPNNTDSLPAVVVRGRHQQQQQQQQQQPLYHDRGSSLFRLSIYTNNVWIQPLSDLTGRYRESSPLLYHEQPALTHRLVPWVNRELAALLPASRIGVVLSDIMDLIERYPIDSTEFRLALRLHLGSRTRHFVHEFYNFARSPYDMVGHDNAAQYIPHYDNENESAEEDSDDEVIEVESDGVVVESEPLDLSSSVAREETIGNDGSVFISSDTDISLSDEENNDIETHRANSDSPSYNFRLTSLFSRSRNLLPSIPLPSSSEERIQTSNGLEEPGPSGVSSSSSASIKKENRNQRNSSDSEDCLIVDILKPKRERTPELINLSSDSEEAVIEGKIFNKTHWKKKMSKEIEIKDTYKQSKGRKRPRLDRTSFSLHFSGTLNCQRGEDHTYCTESASPCNPSSNRTESDDDFGRNHNDHESRSSFRSKPQRQRWNRVESDSDSDMETEISASLKKRSKTATTKHRRERTSRHRAVSSSVSRSFPSLRKSRKDQKSKVKSSSKGTKSVTQITSKEGKPPSLQSSSKRKVTSSHKPKKGNSSNSYKRSRHDSTSSSSSSLSSRSSDSSSNNNSSSSTSTTTTSSSSTSSTSSSSSSERRSRSHLLVFKNSSVSSESESSSSSYSTSSFIVSSSSDSEYYPSKRSASCKRKDKQNTARIPRAVDKNKSERNLDKRNPSKTMNTKKSKYHKK